MRSFTHHRSFQIELRRLSTVLGMLNACIRRERDHHPKACPVGHLISLLYLDARRRVLPVYFLVQGSHLFVG